MRNFFNWLDRRDFKNEENFLSKAISSGSSLARTLILLLFVLGLFYLIATNLVDRVLGDGGEMSISSTGNLIISNKRKEKIQVLSVPAYRNFTATDIKFSEVNKLTIRTTGLVSTGLQVPGFMKEKISKQSDNISNLNERLSKLEFYPGWREANGNLIQNFKKASIGETCINDESEKKRILPDKEYGILLGFFADGEDKAKEILRKKSNDFFVVGKEAEITLDSSSKKVVVKHKDGKASKSFDLDQVKGSSIYFTVNDSIINQDQDFEMFSKCAEQEGDEQDKKQAQEQVKNYKELYNNINDNKGDKAAIWFMDNRGNFTVSIVTNLQ